MKKLAQESIANGSQALEHLIQYHVEMLMFLNKKTDNLTTCLLDTIKNANFQDMEIVTSIKIISNITASHFLCEIRTIDRFETRNKLIVYAGTDPSVRQSGTSLHSNGRISKKGSASLRRYFYIMAMGVMKNNTHFKTYYCRKISLSSNRVTTAWISSRSR